MRFRHWKKACSLEDLEAENCNLEADIQVLVMGNSSEVDGFNFVHAAYGDNPDVNLILSDVNMLSGYPRDRFRYQSLAGDLHFNNLIVFNSWNEYWNGLRHAERRAKDAGIPNATYTVPTPAQQYMMQSFSLSLTQQRFYD